MKAKASLRAADMRAAAKPPKAVAAADTNPVAAPKAAVTRAAARAAAVAKSRAVMRVKSQRLFVCAVLAILSFAPASAQDEFHGRSSQPTGTQGVVGNPNCPPPV